MASSLIDTLDWSAIVMNRWIAMTIFVFGMTGNLLNLTIFTRGRFVQQSCSLYFVAISINNLVMFFIGLLTRILDDGFQVNLFGGSSNIYCKIRTYFVFTLFAISNWHFVIATLDRLYSTNQSALKRQQICSTRMVIKFVALVITGCMVLHVHVPIFYNYFYKLNPYSQLMLSCTANDPAYNIFFSIFMLIFYSLLPPICMIIIGVFTLNNVRHSRREIKPSITASTAVRRDEHQFIRSLSVQILVLTILTTPHSCYWIYMAFSTSQNFSRTTLIRAWEKFILHIVRLLLYVNYGSSFYIQLYMSKTFKQEFLKLIDNMKRRLRNLC